MAIPQLVPSSNNVAFQNTTFSIDALGRLVCNTWEEATENGGAQFDVVVIGSGMYGAYLATKINRLAPSKRVLVLEAGSFLIGEHVQNIGRVGLDVPGEIPPSSDPGIPRELVWGIPWRGNVPFPGLAYCVGGKSVYWGGWCPKLTDNDLSNWPTSTANYLINNYSELAKEIGVEPTTDFISGNLQTALSNATIAATPTVSNIELAIGNDGVEEAPLAVQGDSPASGLFSFDKYSSVPLLISAIREDSGKSGGNDANRKIFLVPNAHVVRLYANSGVVDTIEVEINGQREFLNISSSCSVVLAASTIESTRLALTSFPTPLMGRNLMAHVRSDFTVRIKRTAFTTPLPLDLDTAALLVRGLATSGARFHIQITASAHSGGSDELLYRMIPDLDLLKEQLANDDPEWVTITLRGVGEMVGDRITPVPNDDGNWINLSPFESDEFGVPRAYAQLKLSPNDLITWDDMDRATVELAQNIAGSSTNIEYLYDGGWQTTPFPLTRPFPDWRRGLGTTYHEAGTLWMGSNPASSVTNEVGRFHHIQNAYACDQSIFPTVGSVNPVLTGLTLARQLAENLAS
ncbi:MAG: GMC oxidoreductase [Prochloraceae cyanobacterium]